jgi:hypothetical protein
LLASRASAYSLAALGVVVFYGVMISVFLTLAVVPAVYTLVARNTRSPQTIARMLEKLRSAAPATAAAPAGNPEQGGAT